VSFKIVYHKHPLAFSPSAISVMPYSQECILGWPYLKALSKVLITVGWVWWRHQSPPY